MTSQLRVTLLRSTNRQKKDQIATVRALGLRKIGDTTTMPDNDAVRGMLHKVRHLVVAEPVEGESDED